MCAPVWAGPGEGPARARREPWLRLAARALARVTASRLRSVQATVQAYDARTRSGTVLLDDGTELAFDAVAFDAGGLRLLRFGQRVNIAVAGERITAITLGTFPLP